MKLQPDRIEGVNAIFSTTHDAVSVNNQVGLQQWRSSVIVPFKGEVVAWACTRHEDLKREDFDALLEREASEQGASMTAMDNATRNAGDLIQKLTIIYNRQRQAAITTELIEIIAGAEAL